MKYFVLYSTIAAKLVYVTIAACSAIPAIGLAQEVSFADKLASLEVRRLGDTSSPRGRAFVKQYSHYIREQSNPASVALLRSAGDYVISALDAGEAWAPIAAYSVGKSWYGREHWPETESFLDIASESLVDTDLKIDSLRLLTQCRITQGAYDGASEAVTAAIELCNVAGPSPSPLSGRCLSLAATIHQMQHNYAGVVQSTQMLINVETAHPTGYLKQEDFAQARMQIAKAYADLGHSQHAIALAEQLLTQYPHWGYDSGLRVATVYDIAQWSAYHEDPLKRIEIVSPYLQDTALRNRSTYGAITYVLGRECIKAQEWESAAELFGAGADNESLLAVNGQLTQQALLLRDAAADAFMRARQPHRALQHLQVWYTAANTSDRPKILERIQAAIELFPADDNDPRFDTPTIISYH